MLERDGQTGYLPPGEHPATLEEIEVVFATTYRRREIMKGLRWVVERLKELGVQTIWIDGSFTTDKERPGDVDVVFDPPVGADTTQWGLLSLARQRDLKKLQRVHLWPHPSLQPAKKGLGRVPLVEWFKSDESDVPKGIVILTEPPGGPA